ncbi:MAG: hypothetical protein AB9846_02255 [Tenuifilaceae bacterium]
MKEAEERIVHEFGKKPVASLLVRLSKIESEIDVNYNLDSLHIYFSNDTSEIIKSAWTVNENGVHISDTFAIRSLINAYNRSEEYLVLLLSQSCVSLYEALNDGITNEIRNDDFPFAESPNYVIDHEKLSDS